MELKHLAVLQIDILATTRMMAGEIISAMYGGVMQRHKAATLTVTIRVRRGLVVVVVHRETRRERLLELIDDSDGSVGPRPLKCGAGDGHGTMETRWLT